MSKKSINDIKRSDDNFLDLTRVTQKPDQDKAKSRSTRKLPALPAVSRRLAYAAAVVAIVAVLGLTGKVLLGSSGAVSNDQAWSSVSGLLSDLPEGEIPTIATIKDVESLIGKDGFYAGAEDGDKVLVYPKSNRAIIYSPSKNQIVKDGNISAQQ